MSPTGLAKIPGITLSSGSMPAVVSTNPTRVKSTLIVECSLNKYQLVGLLDQFTSAEYDVPAESLPDACTPYWFIFGVKIPSRLSNVVGSVHAPLDIQALRLAVQNANSLDMLRFQRQDRLKLLVRKGYITPLVETLEKIRSLPEVVKGRIIVVGGSVLSALGTTWTEDVDLMIDSRDGFLQSEGGELRRDVLSILGEKVDASVYSAKGWCDHGGRPLADYTNSWYTYEWPRLAGANNIENIFDDGLYHFFWLGVKFMSVELVVLRLKMRARPSSLTDLIALNAINGLSIALPCLPYRTVIQGRERVHDQTGLKKVQDTLINNLHSWYGVPYFQARRNINQALALCFPCQVLNHSKLDPLLRDVERAKFDSFFRHVSPFATPSKVVIEVRNGGYILPSYWVKANMKFVVVLEASTPSYLKAHKVLSSIENMKIVNAVGDRRWSNGDATEPKFRLDMVELFRTLPRVDVCTFPFSLQRFLKDGPRIGELFNNLNELIKDQGFVVVATMNSEEVIETCRNHPFEIRHTDGSLIYKIALRFDASRRPASLASCPIRVFSKGVICEQTGGTDIDDNLIPRDLLVARFHEEGFRCVSIRTLDDVHDHSAELSRAHTGLLKLYHVFVFQRAGIMPKRKAKCLPIPQEIREAVGSHTL